MIFIKSIYKMEPDKKFIDDMKTIMINIQNDMPTLIKNIFIFSELSSIITTV